MRCPSAVQLVTSLREGRNGEVVLHVVQEYDVDRVAFVCHFSLDLVGVVVDLARVTIA